MQPFALTVEGDHDTISDELAGALGNVFAGDTADQASADVAHTLAAGATQLVAEQALGAGVTRYTVSIVGVQHATGAHDGLDGLTLSVTAIGRDITQQESGSPAAGQV